MPSEHDASSDLTEIAQGLGVPLLDRRSFLKRAGLGSLALASLPTLAPALARTARAGDLIAFHGVAVSSARGDPPAPWVAITANGTVHDSKVTGGGKFAHFLFPGPDVPPPFELLAHGNWLAKEVISWSSIGEYGGIIAGTLELGVELWPAGGVPFPGPVPATLTIICNVGPGGLQTGELEGFTLTIPAAGLTFHPRHPELGLTAFTWG